MRQFHSIFIPALTALAFGMTTSLPAFAQSAANAPMAATAATTVPMLVRYSGIVAHGNGKPETGETTITFLIFKDEKGGEPLWAESQSVAVDATDHYEVHLGAMSASGLPAELFASGEARWLEVQFAGSVPTPRVLLASVPYAMNAATLGGLPASAFALAGTQPAQVAAGSMPSGISPDAPVGVTTTGGGTHFLPIFTGVSTIANSEIYDTGTSVGVGNIPAAGFKLDVNGPSILRGTAYHPSTANATSSTAYPSFGLDFTSSVFNSSTGALDSPNFQLQSEPAGNNTSNTSGTLNLLYANHGSTPSETGLSINSNGIISFASGQTLTSVTSNTTAVTGASTSGDGVYGISSSNSGVQGLSSSGTGVAGTSTSADGVLGYTLGYTSNTGGVVGQAGGTSGFGGVAGVWGDSYTHVGVLGTSYQSTGIQGMTGGNTLGTAGVFGLAGSRTSFGGIAAVWGDSATHVGVFGSSNQYSGVYGASVSSNGIQGSSTSGHGGQFTSAGTNATVYATNTASSGGASLYGTATGTDGFAVYASAQGAGGTGVAGYATAGPDTYGGQPNGVYGYSTGNGVLGNTTGGALSTAGVLGIAGGRSGVGGIAGVWGDAVAHVGVIGSSLQYSGVYGFSSSSYGVQGNSSAQAGVYGVGGGSSTNFGYFGSQAVVGVWGDITGANSAADYSTAIAGTANNGFAGQFTNNSSLATLTAYNYGSGPGSDDAIFKTFQASTVDGTCGFGGKGNMTCTGQVKTLSTTGNGTRTVETYAMQSPENWMEDFGSATLNNGATIVSIDPAFAGTVSDNADYHVFLTPNGDSRGLYVVRKSTTSFEVRESGGGTSTLGFDYRIVAKRRGYEAQRMTDVTDAMKVVNARTADQSLRFREIAKP